MTNNDPRGYYRVLGLQPNADAVEIKAAFRRKAMELHPDRNDAPNATEQFQLLNEAYGVLSIPELRAQYDTMSIDSGPTAPSNQRAEETQLEPIVCSCCGKVTAQPRYAIFREIKSFILITTRSVVQGIFCSACAEKKVLKASAITWTIGWWAIPWGPIYSVQAIISNLFGGMQPANINARLAAHQAWFFAIQGKTDIARAIALDAMDLAKKIKPDGVSAKFKKGLGYDVPDEGTELRGQIQKLLELLGDGGPGRLKDSWTLLRRPFYVQGSVIAFVASCIGIAIFSDTSNSYAPPLIGKSPKPYMQAPPVTSAPSIASAPVQAPVKPKYIRPSRAPNGQHWPKFAGYIKGYASLNENGLSQVTIDNNQNDSDVFVKLVSLDGAKAFPARTFYIPSHGSFTLHNVTAGSYDVRYQDLNSGGRSRSEQFSLEETPTYQGTRYSNVTLTLYKVRNGNMKTYDLADDEF
ncbi:J domain-containing protein [Herbaspirillum sp. WKF16]|uniref:J domain-containing protein n=1 Tax=Herbaspirillum sp. WKF16 TaxID=3028312 RepID=UPI0023A9F249|nr:J domain-containing protein [Herbaspirillum sp. WKF16]WDZ95207.1 J domain-containing protein [Herbaspirillum sp. WKF16]